MASGCEKKSLHLQGHVGNMHMQWGRQKGPTHFIALRRIK